MQKLQTVNAETLLYEPLEKPSFVVDSLIPTGLSLFCGSQKIGKSWLMLKLCLCVSQGIPLWDMPTMEGDVLYLCLEDTFCRIQDRLFRLTDEASGRLHFAVASCKLSDGLIVQLEDYLKDYPDSRLIVIDTLQKVRTASKDNAYASDYGDISLMERITERNFEMMSGKYQKEQLEIEARLKEVTETLNESYEKSRGIRDFLALIRNYQGLKELDATVINALIDKILVSEREKMADGTVKQEIKIYYKFIGFVDELHIIPTKRWAAMPAKNCTVCGVEYVPGSGASRYCPACAKKIRREKSNESKRRSREQKRIACMNCPQKMTD